MILKCLFLGQNLIDYFKRFLGSIQVTWFLTT